VDNKEISNRGKWVKVVPTIIQLLKERPRYKDEIIDVLKKEGLIKKGQRVRVFEDALNSLEKAGLIKLGNDNRLYWKEYEWYKNELDYKAKIGHSRILLGIDGVRDEESVQKILERNVEKFIENRYIQQHIITGYPEITEIFLSLRELEREIKEKQDEVLKISKEIANSLGYPTPFSRYTRHVEQLIEFEVMPSDVEDVFVLIELKKHHPKWGEIDKEARKKIANSVYGILVGMYRLRSIKDDIIKTLGNELCKLSIRVLHGTPLKGHCELCPRIGVENND
jgi:hypothetical protein